MIKYFKQKLNPPNTERVRTLRGQVLSKALVLMTLQNGEVITLPVGQEWHDSRLVAGLQVREIKGYRDNEDSMLILVDGPRGAFVKPHLHENTEVIMCVRGRVRCDINDMDLTVGKTWEVAEGSLHSIEFLEDSLLAIMWHPRFEALKPQKR